MTLTFRRTGGFAGIQEVLGTVDTAGLGGEAQRTLAAQLLDLTRLAAAPASPGADRFRYEVDIQEPGQAPRTLVILDEGDPELPGPRALAALMRTAGVPPP